MTIQSLGMSNVQKEQISKIYYKGLQKRKNRNAYNTLKVIKINDFFDHV